MDAEVVAAIIQSGAALLTVAVFYLGGHALVTRIEITKKRREQEVELLRTVREQQYSAVLELYDAFREFMAIYRQANSSMSNLSDIPTRRSLLDRSIAAEARVDALIVRIGSEFPIVSPEMPALLGELRQSVQIWRESIQVGEFLPFQGSEQWDYVRFKSSFAKTAALMTAHIHGDMEPPSANMERARDTILTAFSNQHERHGKHLPPRRQDVAS